MTPTAVPADCTADPAGTLTFTFAPEAVSGPEPVLLLRRRGEAGRRPGGTVRLPLGASGPGRLRAVLESSTGLPEGRWDVYVEEAGEERTVEPGLRDLRALVDRSPDAGATTVSTRLPYPTLDGRLAVRSWVRAPHAEAGDITLGPAGMTAEGRLYGVGVGEGAAVEARLPGDPARVHRVPLTAADGPPGAFTFTLPYAALATAPVREEQLWRLWLIPDAGAAGIRISRILDDLWTRKQAYAYPARPAADGVLATPVYTNDNDFCVRLEPGPAAR